MIAAWLFTGCYTCPKQQTPAQAKVIPDDEDATIAAPTLVSPADHARINTWPRNLPLKWMPVEGAVSYTVQVDIGYKGKWSYDQGRIYRLTSSIHDTTWTLEGFAGAQPGRWRVWARDKDGHSGHKSEWREFEFTI